GKKGADEHRAFVEAVRDGDAKRAQTIMMKHLGRTAARVAALPA
ncbi:MAG: FCD domain-containing protein, partial [Trebonia sp.]